MQVHTYTHYPTISTDMLQVVYERRPGHNHDALIAGSRARNAVKLVYYLLFSIAYGIVGSFADFVMVNSSWTCNHIRSLWLFAPPPEVVFPPCDATGFASLPLSSPPRKPLVLSIGQFRPEKDHALQIRSFARMLSKPGVPKGATLVLLGGVRDEGDQGRVDELRSLCESLGVEKRVEFVLNQPYSVLKDYLGKSSVGLHCMWNEHFGIGVVEMMAAGLVVVAHDSGGPKADIIKDLVKEGECRTGFLAATEEQYCDCMWGALKKGAEPSMAQIRENAREAAFRFSDEVFDERMESLLRETLT
ncbi:hypothetical protein TeGR_g1494 [Tetraparma gracilis]|uniref:GDP-Man:Man(3)GlcNAc(2)-PP-Dol alpha-1,2-mannosyltransferase n=1 Tax=Tetraparma gracilis TaxID=2962635 RepID=A0ABQ6NEP9_9STRA|nr:hypothetical protein TeGR_g1494 [Tetraparma gracilis]